VWVKNLLGIHAVTLGKIREDDLMEFTVTMNEAHYVILQYWDISEMATLRSHAAKLSCIHTGSEKLGEAH
jgi:hypothetical protein